MGSVTLATTVDRRIPVTSWLSLAKPTDVMLSTTPATPAVSAELRAAFSAPEWTLLDLSSPPWSLAVPGGLDSVHI
jgi:hypothetical protein